MRTNCQSTTRRLAFAAVAVSMMVIPGCIEAERSHFVRYDRDTDEFRVLTVFSHIGAEKAEDLEYLSALWNLRSNLIVPVADFSMGEPAYVRRDDSTYLLISLGERSSKALESQHTRISLDSLSIKPGQFFVGKANTLCCYHQIVVPGKTADAMLKDLAKPINDFVVAAVNEERKRRADGGPVASWEDVRSALLAASLDGATAKNGDAVRGKGAPLALTH